MKALLQKSDYLIKLFILVIFILFLQFKLGNKAYTQINSQQGPIPCNLIILDGLIAPTNCFRNNTVIDRPIISNNTLINKIHICYGSSIHCSEEQERHGLASCTSGERVHQLTRPLTLSQLSTFDIGTLSSPSDTNPHICGIDLPANTQITSQDLGIGGTVTCQFLPEDPPPVVVTPTPPHGSRCTQPYCTMTAACTTQDNGTPYRVTAACAANPDGSCPDPTACVMSNSAFAGHGDIRGTPVDSTMIPTNYNPSGSAR